MRGTVGGSKRVQLEVFGDPQGPSRGCIWRSQYGAARGFSGASRGMQFNKI